MPEPTTLHDWPRYLLFTETTVAAPRFDADGELAPQLGRWRFLLESLHGEENLEASDSEPQVAGDRLELLAVVRGLEALDQPSRVILLTPSWYVQRGLRFGLPAWRESGWQWERFGEMSPVKNDDLWRRVDRAMQFHALDCRNWRLHRAPAEPAPAPVPRPHFLRRRPSVAATVAIEGEVQAGGVVPVDSVTPPGRDGRRPPSSNGTKGKWIRQQASRWLQSLSDAVGPQQNLSAFTA